MSTLAFSCEIRLKASIFPCAFVYEKKSLRWTGLRSERGERQLGLVPQEGRKETVSQRSSPGGTSSAGMFWKLSELN